MIYTGNFKSDAEDIKEWLNSLNWQPPEHLQLATFEGVRGLMTTKNIEENELVVSIPHNVLITSSTVTSSILGPCLKDYHPKLSPLRALCAFLMVERCIGCNSEWSPYIEMLPKTYSTPAFWPACQVQSFPKTFQDKVRKQKVDLRLEYEKLRPFLKHISASLSLSREIMDFALFRWAWFSVNTRCIFMQQLPSSYFNHESNCYALAPFLDFLNHSCQARVRAGFNQATKTYDIVTLTNIRKYEQVFISYGFHDNVKLLLEYGFVLTGNPHSVVSFSVDDVLNSIMAVLGQTCLDLALMKVPLLRSEQTRDLCGRYDGPSWCLTSTVDQLVCPSSQIDAPKLVLNALFKKRLKDSLARKESLAFTQKSKAYSSMARDLYNEEIDILNICCDITNFS